MLKGGWKKVASMLLVFGKTYYHKDGKIFPSLDSRTPIFELKKFGCSVKELRDEGYQIEEWFAERNN